MNNCITLTHSSQEKTRELHTMVVEGRMRELKGEMGRREDAMRRDAAGMNLLHKAVIYRHLQLVRHLVDKFPAAVNVVDNVS